MNLVPGGLVDSQRRLRPLQVTPATDWYVVEPGRFDYVGAGELSEADLRAVRADLPAGVFVAVRHAKAIEEVLEPTKFGSFGMRRLALAAKVRDPDHPKLGWVARGARVAVLPAEGIVWVDQEHLFSSDESATLPWTRPAVTLATVEPKVLRAAMAETLGPSGPMRATSVFER